MEGGIVIPVLHIKQVVSLRKERRGGREGRRRGERERKRVSCGEVKSYSVVMEPLAHLYLFLRAGDGEELSAARKENAANIKFDEH